MTIPAIQDFSTRAYTDDLAAGVKSLPSDDPGLSESLRDMIELFQEDPPPQEEVFAQTYQLLVQSSQRLDNRLPPAHVVSDERGGIRLAWASGKRRVRLVVPAGASDRSYLYWEEGTRHTVEYEPDLSTLVDWLRWLQADADDTL